MKPAYLKANPTFKAHLLDQRTFLATFLIATQVSPNSAYAKHLHSKPANKGPNEFSGRSQTHIHARRAKKMKKLLQHSPPRVESRVTWAMKPSLKKEQQMTPAHVLLTAVIALAVGALGGFDLGYTLGHDAGKRGAEDDQLELIDANFPSVSLNMFDICGRNNAGQEARSARATTGAAPSGRRSAMCSADEQVKAKGEGEQWRKNHVSEED